MSFEDDIQISAAVRSGLDSIVTRTPAGFAGGPIPVLSPTDLLALLASKSPPVAPSAAVSDEEAKTLDRRPRLIERMNGDRMLQWPIVSGGTW